MLRNYLKIAARHLWHQRGFAAMNVGGLAVGMATCLLIGLYVQDELSYDTFHPQADRILALTVEQGADTQRGVPYALCDVLTRKVPGVQRVTGTSRRAWERTVRYRGNNSQIERTQRVLEADSSFFDVLSGFPMHRGRAETMLDAPDQLVITKSTARAFFGGRNPIGEALTVVDDSARRYTVTGVTSVPPNSTIQFDVVVPLTNAKKERRRWNLAYKIYAWVGPGVTPERLGQVALQGMHEGQRRDEGITGFSAVPLSELYLSGLHQPGGFKGQPRSLYIFGTIALLILLIAAINYVNLLTVQAERRAREVGVRKTMGASRRQVAYQFMGEALLLSGLALAVAIVLVIGALPAFNALFDKNLSLSAARHGWALLNGIGVVLGVSLLAGAYPAVVLSEFAPTRILRGASATTTGSGGWLRKGLVVTQFAASAGLILGTIVIYQQLDHVQTKDLGLDAERVVMIDLGEWGELFAPSTENRDQILEKIKSFERVVRRRAARHPDVVEASIRGTVPGRFIGLAYERASKELSSAARAQRQKIELRLAEVDTNYIETLGLSLLAGRRFVAAAPGRRAEGYVLNEAAVEAMGWTVEGAIGKPFSLGEGAPDGEVIGVVKNFHVESMREEIAPVALTLGSDVHNGLTVRLAPDGYREAIDHLRRVVNETVPEANFSYTFLDDRFDQMYRSEKRIGRIFAGFALIAVVIACMGLFALAAFAVRRRTKEIGIRKALGATARSIVALLSKEYAALLAVAFAVGTPVAYVGIQRWLQDFAYRVNVGAGPFVWTAGLAVLVAGLSVSVHALRAAYIDPARALRDE